MNNIIGLIRSMIGKLSPQQIVMNLLKDNANPIFGNLINMAQKGDTGSVENFARNYFKENGRDYDQEFSKFMSNFK